jgi:hypothetical protein
VVSAARRRLNRRSASLGWRLSLLSRVTLVDERADDVYLWYNEMASLPAPYLTREGISRRPAHLNMATAGITRHRKTQR